MCTFQWFDDELIAARDETSQEKMAKEQLAREKATMKADMEMLQQELNVSCHALNKSGMTLYGVYTHTRSCIQNCMYSLCLDSAGVWLIHYTLKKV